LKSIDLTQNCALHGLNFLPKNKRTFDEFSCLVKLKAAGTKQPLFLVHPVTCTIFCYMDLARYLVNEHPFIAIQDPLLEDKPTILANIEDMARYYIQAIKAVQNDGHYLIGGYSFGSNVAFEMARQLEQQGEIVSLFIIDGWVRYSKHVRGDEERLDLMKVIEKINDKLPNLVQNKNKFLKLQKKRVEMSFQYNPQRLKTKIVLLKAKETWPRYAPSNCTTNCWQDYTEVPIESHMIAGNHISIMSGEGPKQIAEVLNSYLLQLDKV